MPVSSNYFSSSVQFSSSWVEPNLVWNSADQKRLLMGKEFEILFDALYRKNIWFTY